MNFMKNDKNQDKIEEWIYICPDIIYENIKTLHDFVKSGGISKNKKTIDSNNRYHCCKDYNKCKLNICDSDICDSSSCWKNCDFLEYCSSYIHYFGIDCVDEKRKRELDIQNDRKWKNNQGSESFYWHHLRLKTIPCDDPLWFLSLRIHFRWDDINNKIEIGWIGRHLFTKCERNEDMNCKRLLECPVHKESNKRDKNLTNFENFLKQWEPWPPKQPEK